MLFETKFSPTMQMKLTKNI